MVGLHRQAFALDFHFPFLRRPTINMIASRSRSRTESREKEPDRILFLDRTYPTSQKHKNDPEHDARHSARQQRDPPTSSAPRTDGSALRSSPYPEPTPPFPSGRPPDGIRFFPSLCRADKKTPRWRTSHVRGAVLFGLRQSVLSEAALTVGMRPCRPRRGEALRE